MMQVRMRRNHVVPTSLIQVKVLKIRNPKMKGKMTLWWRLSPPGTISFINKQMINMDKHGAFNHLCCVSCVVL